MAVNLQDMQAQDDAYAKQVTDAQNAKQSQETLQGGQQTEPSFLQKWVTGPMGRVTTSMVDSAVSAADSYSNSDAGHKARDVVAGAITGATNIADTAVKAATTNFSMDDAGKVQESQSSPIWDHAKGAILDFRDAVAVQDPTLADNLTQTAGQLAIPFAGYSRALAGVHGFANAVAANALTDATALDPHATRMADLIALGRHVEGKFGQALQALAPDGSAQNAYINYLTSGHAAATPEERAQTESDAEGRFKNVLDGFGANLIATPLLHSVGMLLKQGTAGLRYAIENGVGSAGALVPANQAGRIGYHGTPTAGFDEFDNSKIGTGEGNQTFGYGHYVAENPTTGLHYQQALSDRNIDLNTPLGIAQHYVDAAAGDKAKAFVRLTRLAGNATGPGAADTFNKAAGMIKAGTVDQGRGALLKVDVADEHIADMLDHDKTLDEQPDVLKKIPPEDQKRLEQILDDHNQNPDLGSLTGGQFRQLIERAHGEDMMVPSDPYETSMPKAASQYLGSKGIPGIKYLDQGSRQTPGEGTRNFVVFDGKHINVLEKNGVKVRGRSQDMSLTKEDRALERERVAAARDREDGVSREHEPEPIPANAARREGAAARRQEGRE